MMDKYTIHGRKPPPFDFKHVRKFAVEHLKKIQQGPSISSPSNKSPSTTEPHSQHSNSYQPSDEYQLELNNMAKDLNTENEALTRPFLDESPKGKQTISIYRDVLSQEEVIKKTHYTARDKSIVYAIRTFWSDWSFLSLFQGVIPIITWLPKYSIKKDLMGDIIAGLTVAIMNIPHGMAYGLLAGIAPGEGLFMGIFPVLAYLLLGTSRHISIGTFAVVSIMTFNVVQSYATDDPEPGEESYTALQVATAAAIMTGIIHLGMALIRAGTLSALLSEPLINGFTTAAACHVVVSQFKDVLGLPTPRHKGYFKIVYTLIDLGKSISSTNLAALTTSCIVMTFMIIMNELVKPWVSKRTRIPVPAELIAVSGGAIISRYCDLNGKYGIKLLGDIPLGLPTPKFPPIELLPMVAPDAIAIAVVSYSIVMSMGLIFAKKHTYEIRPNQELFALGVGNIFAGCFSCIPMACSLSRSVLQDQTGGRTQIASLVSVFIMLMTVLWIGPFFSPLPRSVLAGVIIIALKSMFVQAKELKKFAQQGKLELLNWFLTFTCAVFIDIVIGLLVGILISVLTLYVKGLKPYGYLLGTISGSDGVYVDIGNHNNAIEVPETKIFRYAGSLNFATRNFYKKAMYQAISVDCSKILRASMVVGGNFLNPFRVLILDFSCLAHIDIAGCRTLSDIKKEMRILGVRIFIASPADRVYDAIVHSMALGEGPFDVFPTLHDAVVYANACRTA